MLSASGIRKRSLEYKEWMEINMAARGASLTPTDHRLLNGLTDYLAACAALDNDCPGIHAAIEQSEAMRIEGG